jgi:hypothetical protein
MRGIRTNQLRRARWGPGALLIALMLLVAACGASAPAAEPRPQQPGADAPPVGLTPDDAQGDQEPDADGRFAGDAIPLDRRIVKNGQVTIEVDDVADNLARLRDLAGEMGGYVGGSQAGTLDERASITLRVPAHRFDELLTRVHELDGRPRQETTREEDVTGAIVDLEARIENLGASEAQYRQLLERAEKIDDILTVQSRLDQVRGQIEQLTAQLKQLSGQADLATLTVTLVPQPRPVETAAAGWDPRATFAEALGSLLAIGQGLITALIWVGVVWLPLLLVLGIVAGIVVRGVLELRRRTALAGTPAGGGDSP